jgi:disulfide bond formation protein DsbB
MEPAVSASLTQSPRGLLPSVLATLGMTGTVGGALAFEHIGGYIPCALCLIQRQPYYWGIPIGIVAIADGRPPPALLDHPRAAWPSPVS